MYTFGARVQKLRVNLGLTQHQLVDAINTFDDEHKNIACHITKHRLGRIERDELEPMYSEICVLSYVLNISMDCLMLNNCSSAPTSLELEQLIEGMSDYQRRSFIRFIELNAQFVVNELDCR